MPKPDSEVLERLLKRERVARKEAESILEGKSRELYEINQKLQSLATSLEERVKERTEELELERNNAIEVAEALRASERKFRDIAEIVGEYFWRTDKDFKFLELTPQAEKVLGFRMSDLIGRTIYDFMTKEDAQTLKSTLLPYTESGRPFKGIRIRSLCRDNKVVWQSIGGAPEYDSEGQLIGFRGAGLDVTEEEKSKQQLKLLDLALEHSSEGFAITDSVGRFNYLNPAHVSIYGYEDSSELLGKHWSMLYTPEEVERLGPDIQRQLSATGGFRGDAVGVRRDGSTFPEIFSLQRLPDGGMLCVCQDDTERRTVLQDLLTQNSMRTELLNNIQEGILFDDARDETSLTNDSLYRLFRLEREEVDLGTVNSIGFFTRIHNQLASPDGLMTTIRELIEKKERTDKIEFRLMGDRVILLDYIPVQGADEFLGHLWSFHDISEERRIQEVLEKAWQEAEAGATAKSVFLANMSHEIRTPLNGIIGINQLLMREQLEPKHRDYVRSIDQSAQSLMRIIDDILDFSKIEAGHLELEIVDFSLLDLLDGIFEMLRYRAWGKRLNFTVIHSPETPRLIRGDPSRLRQVLLNLASNAIKFTESGFVSIRVQLLESSNGKLRLEFSIADSGIGMSEDALKKLFQPFTQAEASITRRFGGTGLGLAISKNLVDLMGGEISATSKPGEGSCFRVTLPFETAESTKKDKPVFEDSGLDVLVTAADERQRDAICAMLKTEGAVVHPQASVSDSLKDSLALAGRKNSGPLAWVIIADNLPLEDILSIPEQLPKPGANLKPIVISDRVKRLKAVLPEDFIFLERPIARKALLFELASQSGIERPATLFPEQAQSPLEGIDMSHLRILLAEDNTINQQVGRITLQEMGALVDIAENGIEAVSMAQDGSYDLIFMDIRMPEMDGLEACRRIRKAGLEVPIVALTADAMKGDSERFLSAGMNDFLTKPLVESKLAEVLRNTLPSKSPVVAEEDPLPAVDTPLDLPALIKILGNDEEMARSLLGDFVQQTTELLERARGALAEEKLDEAGSAFHKISGSAFSLRAQDLAEKALASEKSLMDENPDEAERFRCEQSVLEAFERLKDTINNITWSS
ncbi:MAG: ATP-binding protein [Puniceicoccaceae bacterium]